MRSRTRTRNTTEEIPPLLDFEDNFDLDSLSEEELEDFLFEEPEKESKGLFNLPTVAGLSLIIVGLVYIFQQLGVLTGFDLGALIAMLPWLAGMLIILLGFGVLSWRPNRKKKRVKKAIDKNTGKRAVIVDDAPGTRTAGKRKRLVKSRNKKIAGVCSGIAEYFNLDPTLVRIAFVIGTIATQGSIIPVYLILAAVMPKAEAKKVEERITIIRDT